MLENFNMGPIYMLENLNVVSPQLHGEEKGQGHHKPADPAKPDCQTRSEDFPFREILVSFLNIARIANAVQCHN